MPLISVLIPYYNDRVFLQKAIESALNQTLADFELVLLNHASGDGSREIARSFDDSRIVHIDLDENNGAGGGIIFKKFVQAARGKYLKLFCADDIMRPNCLEVLHGYLSSNPQKDIVFGDENFIDGGGADLNRLWSEEYKDFSFNDTSASLIRKYFYKKSFLPLGACMFKRGVAADLVADNTLINEFDQSLWIQMLLQGRDFGFVKDVVCDYRIHDGQMSREGGANKIFNYDFYESIVRAKIFFGVKDFERLKILLDGSPLLERLSAADGDFFAFAVACHYLENHPDPSCKIAGYEFIHDCLENPAFSEALKKKFGFSVADFRRLYTNAFAPSEKAYLSGLGIKALFWELLKKMRRKIFAGAQ